MSNFIRVEKAKWSKNWLVKARITIFTRCTFSYDNWAFAMAAADCLSRTGLVNPIGLVGVNRERAF